MWTFRPLATPSENPFSSMFQTSLVTTPVRSMAFFSTSKYWFTTDDVITTILSLFTPRMTLELRSGMRRRNRVTQWSSGWGLGSPFARRSSAFVRSSSPVEYIHGLARAFIHCFRASFWPGVNFSWLAWAYFFRALSRVASLVPLISACDCADVSGTVHGGNISGIRRDCSLDRLRKLCGIPWTRVDQVSVEKTSPLLAAATTCRCARATA